MCLGDIQSTPMTASIHHLVWFRRDLRLGDNPAWAAATQRSDEVTALFVLDPALFDRAGPYRQQALVAHLQALDTQLRERGGRLRVEHGDPTVVVPAVADSLHADMVHRNTDTTPYAVPRDQAVAAKLPGRVQTHWGTLVHEPGRVLTGKGTSVEGLHTVLQRVEQDRDVAVGD